MFRTIGIVLAASVLGQGGIPAEKAFKDYGDFQAGGVWHTTDAKGKKAESRFEWILDKSFLHHIQKEADGTFQNIFGIDPATGQFSYWGFDDKGRVWKGVVESAKAGEWTYRESGHGKDGPNSFKGKEVKLEADKTQVDIQEFIQDGKNQLQAPLTRVWTRKK